MGGNPILLKLSQIDERADAKRAVDIVAGVDAAVTGDSPGITAAVVATPDAP